MAAILDKLQFLSPHDVQSVASQFGTPVYVYDEKVYQQKIKEALTMPNAFGLNVRLAMKACGPNPTILGIFRDAGLGIDASSIYEAQDAIAAGFTPDRISISAQQMYKEDEWAVLLKLCEQNAHFNACSLRQLEEYGRRRPSTAVGVRLNPGLGTGHSNKTNVGGPSSSFGIWHEYTARIKAIAQQYDLTIERIHTHIGTGGDPEVWTRAAKLTLGIVGQFADVTTVDLGGGFKVARIQSDAATSLQSVGPVIKEAFEAFKAKTGRKLFLEIEPGTFLTANAGAIVSEITDIKDTGAAGHEFILVDTGMTEILRPSLYGSQHALIVVSPEPRSEVNKYVVAGRNCESGDILTPKPGNPDEVAERTLQVAEVGDLMVVEGAGAYCASMSARGYNSFPAAKEILRKANGDFVDISFRN